MLDAYLDYSYYLVYIFYFEILEEKNHDFFENWELMIHANFGTEVHSIAQKWTGWAMMVITTPSHSKLFYNSNSAKLCWSWQKSNMLLAAGICNKENFEVFLKLELVDASADPKNRVGGCLHRPQTGVGRCLHQLQFWVAEASTDSVFQSRRYTTDPKAVNLR